jgi:hypothetical protein
MPKSTEWRYLYQAFSHLFLPTGELEEPYHLLKQEYLPKIQGFSNIIPSSYLLHSPPIPARIYRAMAINLDKKIKK